jgi:hypothetical protein
VCSRRVLLSPSALTGKKGKRCMSKSAMEASFPFTYIQWIFSYGSIASLAGPDFLSICLQRSTLRQLAISALIAFIPLSIPLAQAGLVYSALQKGAWNIYYQADLSASPKRVGGFVGGVERSHPQREPAANSGILLPGTPGTYILCR